MDNFYIKPYQVTGAFWRWVALAHVLVVCLASWYAPRHTPSTSVPMYLQVRAQGIASSVAMRSASAEVQRSGASESDLGAVSSQPASVLSESSSLEPPAPEERAQVETPKPLPLTPSASSVVHKHKKSAKTVSPAPPKKKTSVPASSAMRKGPSGHASQGGSQGKSKASQAMLDVLLASSGTVDGAVSSELGALAEGDSRVNEGIERIRQHIAAFWVLPTLPPAGSFVTCRIRLTDQGQLVEVKKIASSGQSVLDHSAIEAIEAASPFPMPRDAETRSLFLDWELTLRPEELF